MAQVWGIVGRWLTFLDELGYLGLLEIEGAGFQRVMIPLARLLLTYQVKVLLGIASINLVPTRLFRDLALLKLIGYTTAQIAAGFCRRGDLAAGPMHPNTLADAVERLSAEELETLLNATVKRLVARGFFRPSQGHFALDASDLETTRRYLGAGMKTITERKVTKKKEIVEIERSVYGFKVLIIYEVRLRLIVAAKVAPINEHESQSTLALVRQAHRQPRAGGAAGAADRRRLPGWRDALDAQTRAEASISWCRRRPRCTSPPTRRPLSRRPADRETDLPGRAAGGAEAGARLARCAGRGRSTVVGVAALGSYDQYGAAEHAAAANRKDFVANRSTRWW